MDTPIKKPQMDESLVEFILLEKQIEFESETANLKCHVDYLYSLLAQQNLLILEQEAREKIENENLKRENGKLKEQEQAFKTKIADLEKVIDMFKNLTTIEERTQEPKMGLSPILPDEEVDLNRGFIESYESGDETEKNNKSKFEIPFSDA